VSDAATLNPPAPTFLHLGPPEWWTCPHCSQHVLLYPALGNNHRCLDGHTYNGNVSIQTFHYYYELADDCSVRSLNLVGVMDEDPLLRVTTVNADGTLAEWPRRVVGDELRFYPPDPARAHECQMWYDDRVQRHEPIPRRELERRALRGRHSA
jgi:hypothetical protein